MILFEIRTGWTGESYERCYVWAVDEEEAREEFESVHGEFTSRHKIQQLFDGDDRLPFVTNLSTEGWET